MRPNCRAFNELETRHEILKYKSSIITPGGGGGYSHTLPIRVCAAQRVQRRFLERGIENCGSRLYPLLKIVADYEEVFI